MNYLMIYKIEKLKDLLQKYKVNLYWDFVKNNSNYDWDICNILWIDEDTGRYWDAQFEGLKIEFKKWRSIWLDLIRYSEIHLWINDNSKEKTITLFFIPDKDRNKIIEIIGVSTDKIIWKLSLNKETSEILIELNNKMPRSLNAQASLTVKDIKDFADFII